MSERSFISLLTICFCVYQMWLLTRRGPIQWILGAITLLLILLSIVQWFRAGRRSGSGAGLGAGPLHLIAPSNMNKEALYELWSSGVRGRELAEAIALEARGQSVLGPPALMIVMTAGISAAIFLLGLFGAWKFLVIAALCAFFLHFYYVCLFGGPSTGVASLRRALKILEAETSGFGWLAELSAFAKASVMPLALAFVFVIGVLPLLIGAITFLGKSARTGDFAAFPHGVVPILIVALLAAISSVLHALRKRMWRSGVRTLVREYRRADVAFDRYVRKVIIGDPDVK